jgi:hypothetical protein
LPSWHDFLDVTKVVLKLHEELGPRLRGDERTLKRGLETPKRPR